MINFIATVLGRVLNWTYENMACNNYGLAIIIFTITIRILLVPITLKQTKLEQKKKTILPKLNELKEKCKGDTQQYNIEAAKLYQEVNPMVGCLSVLLQLTVLWALYKVIAKPLTYMRAMDSAEITKWINLVPPEKRILGSEQLAAVAHSNLLNMNFLGTNLASVPKLEFNLLLLWPILATVVNYISSKYVSNSAPDDETKAQSRYLLYLSPVITFIFSFKVPLGLSIYWITSSLLQIVQQWYVNKYVKESDSKDFGKAVG